MGEGGTLVGEGGVDDGTVREVGDKTDGDVGDDTMMEDSGKSELGYTDGVHEGSVMEE